MKSISDLSIPNDLADLCNPQSTALLIYDMQVGIAEQISGGTVIIQRCKAALSAARSAGMRVVYTRHLSCPKPWMGVTQYRSAMAWQKTDDLSAVKPWFLRDAPATAVVPELSPTADDLLLDKLSMSAFEGTPLAYALKDCGLTGIAICGIAVEIGIEPTLRHATDLGFIPIVLKDACGFGNASAGARSFETMKFVGEAMVTNVDNFAGLLHQREVAGRS